MELGINTAIKLTKEVHSFKSPHVKGLTLNNTEYFLAGQKSLNIETSKITDWTGVNAEYSSKKLSNGAKFEVYRMKDAVLKIIKDKFGEIKAYKFKGMEKSEAMPKESIIENTKLAFASKIRSFLD